MGGLTLDTGALIALERNRRDMVKVVEAAREARSPILAPANVLAEWWRGRTDRREHVRKMFVVKDVDEKVAKLAGEAMASLNRRRVVVDDKRRRAKSAPRRLFTTRKAAPRNDNIALELAR